MLSDTSTPTPARGRHQRHWLVPREHLAAGYAARYGSPAVSEYALAVRDLVERSPEIGTVDTWSRLAERICRNRPGRDRDTWRKRLSRHFTTETKGPPWQTVVLVVECTVAPADRQATLRRFERLYEAARGEPPTDRRPTDGRAHPHGPGPQVTSPDGSTPTTDDAGRIIAQLRAENAVLRRTLAAREAENDLLRATIKTANRTTPKGHPHRAPDGGNHPADPSGREAALLDGPARKDRNPGHFPAGPTPTNDAPAGRHRPPRIDTVSLPPRIDVVGPPPHRPMPRPHPPGGIRRA
ncbi:hypothetical protein [Micromonospora humida]|uniref:Uncharacterized protein n=1 Tax=Micromonospora humida TaxID=2809018 RepID=A0ABS2IUH7_9ACTN|nr:hypothetical protein [Micromonospora humida]MBM7077621.1 hypothetical protein [Micromonospora humida]